MKKKTHSQPETSESIPVVGAASVKWSCVCSIVIPQTHFISWKKVGEKDQDMFGRYMVSVNQVFHRKSSSVVLNFGQNVTSPCTKWMNNAVKSAQSHKAKRSLSWLTHLHWMLQTCFCTKSSSNLVFDLQLFPDKFVLFSDADRNTKHDGKITMSQIWSAWSLAQSNMFSLGLRSLAFDSAWLLLCCP